MKASDISFSHLLDISEIFRSLCSARDMVGVAASKVVHLNAASDQSSSKVYINVENLISSACSL